MKDAEKGRGLLLVTFASVVVAMLTLAGAAWVAVISNPSPISIPGGGQATPYPSSITVSGLSGTITDVNLTLRGVRHTFADDVAVLLVGPGGQKVMLMSDAGGGQDLNGVDLSFDDEATRSLPDGAGTQITTGSYKPTRGANSGVKVPSSLPSPAPPVRISALSPRSMAPVLTALTTCMCSTTNPATRGRSPADSVST